MNEIMTLPPHLTVKEGHLNIGNHDTVALAKKYGTPLYVTDEQRIRANFMAYKEALAGYYDRVQMLYAAKANGNLAVLRVFADMGAGADVFSAGELYLALVAGMRPDHLLFNGSSKTAADLKLAVQKKVRVSLDSIDEMKQLNEVARAMGTTVECSFRVNPAMEVPCDEQVRHPGRPDNRGVPGRRRGHQYHPGRAALPHRLPDS